MSVPAPMPAQRYAWRFAMVVDEILEAAERRCDALAVEMDASNAAADAIIALGHSVGFDLSTPGGCEHARAMGHADELAELERLRRAIETSHQQLGGVRRWVAALGLLRERSPAELLELTIDDLAYFGVI